MEEARWDDREERVCARAALCRVSAAAAEATKGRDPLLQQQQRSAQALLHARQPEQQQQQQQQQQQLMHLARARLPGFVRLPPHQRVSHYYDHVRVVCAHVDGKVNVHVCARCLHCAWWGTMEHHEAP